MVFHKNWVTLSSGLSIIWVNPLRRVTPLRLYPVKGERKMVLEILAPGVITMLGGATYTQYDNNYTGYNGYGYNNYFDNEYRIAPLGGTIKQTEHNGAHARWWRGKWRLPTENEFRALYAACTFEVIGTYRETNTRYIGSERATKTRSFSIIKVTSNVNGNVIYFSTGGYLDGTVEPTIGEDGKPTDSGDGKKNEGLIYTDNAYYLTSSSSHTILRCVSYAKFSAKLQEINLSGSRYTGMLVRPVYSPNEY